MPTHVAQRAPIRCSRSSAGRAGGAAEGGPRAATRRCAGGWSGLGEGRGHRRRLGDRRRRRARVDSGGRPVAAGGALERPHPVEQPTQLALERGDTPVRALGRRPRARREQRDDGEDERDHGEEQAERE